ncbi:MAG: colanic acid biosynthesis acetyltransferase WcaF [Phycisphaerae bacterium]|nr:colanic acid biosynthesis acetyltransferase WcaF [Phycisphaerae bacterium]
MTNPEVQGNQEAAMASAPPARRSAWTTRQKIVRVVWATIGRICWQVAPLRAPVLRLFGGTVGRDCRLARSIDILIPWNISLGDRVHIGEHVILYALGPISIGSGTVVDVRAHLCAGSHDMHDTRFPLTRPPITIGEDCFIGVDAYIAPEVELGDRCRVRHRASVYRSFPPETVLEGNPARSCGDGE